MAAPQVPNASVFCCAPGGDLGTGRARVRPDGLSELAAACACRGGLSCGGSSASPSAPGLGADDVTDDVAGVEWGRFAAFRVPSPPSSAMLASRFWEPSCAAICGLWPASPGPHVAHDREGGESGADVALDPKILGPLVAAREDGAAKPSRPAAALPPQREGPVYSSLENGIVQIYNRDLPHCNKVWIEHPPGRGPHASTVWSRVASANLVGHPIFRGCFVRIKLSPEIQAALGPSPLCEYPVRVAATEPAASLSAPVMISSATRFVASPAPLNPSTSAPTGTRPRGARRALWRRPSRRATSGP